MARNTQNTNLSTVVKSNDAPMTNKQQAQWSAMVLKRTSDAMQAKSINNIIKESHAEESKGS